MSSDDTFIRPLGGMEKFSRGRSIHGFFKNHSVSIRFNESISIDLLFHVLRELVLEHPTLVCHAATEDSEGEPVGIFLLQKLYLRDLVKFDSANTLDETLSDRVLEEYAFDANDATKPLLKILVLEENKELVCVADHILIDGVASSLFWQLFQKKLIEVDQRTELLSSVDYDTAVLFDLSRDKPLISTKFLPTAEDLYPTVPSTYHSWAKWIKSYLPKSLQKYIYTYTADREGIPGYTKWKVPPFETIRLKTGHKYIHFTPTEVEQIIRACRQHKSTITAYLDYCMLYTIINGQHAIGFDKEKHYATCIYIIGNRRHLTEDQKRMYDSTFGNHYVAGYSNSIAYPDVNEFSWDKVTEINQEMTSVISDPRHIQNIVPILKICENTKNLQKFLTERLFKERIQSFSISNLGMTNFDNDSKWAVQDIKFTQDPTHIGAHCIASVTSTKLGGMNVCFSYIDSSMSNVDKMVESIKEAMLSHS